MKSAFDFTSTALLGKNFDIDAYVHGKTIPSRDELTTYAIEWVLNNIEERKPPLNRPFYHVPKEHAAAVLALKNALSLGLNEKIAALNTFFASFLNNPYTYEHCLNESEKSSLATCWHISGYYVNFVNISIPIGILDVFWDDTTVSNIISAFMIEKNNQFDSTLAYNAVICDGYSKKNEAEKKTKSEYKKHVILTILLFLLVVPFIVNRLFVGVDWANIPYVSTSSGNIFHAVGYLTEAAYGINRNSIIGFLCVTVAILWFFRVLSIILPFKDEAKMLYTYSRRFSVYKKARKISSCLQELQNSTHAREEFTLANFKQLKHVVIRKSKVNQLPSYICELNKTALSATVKHPARKLPTTKKLAFLLVMAIITTGLHVNLTSDDVINGANNLAKTVTTFVEEVGFHASLKYTVKEPSVLYGTSTRGSVPLYDIRPGDYFRILQSSSDADAPTQIRIFTEYGYINGWVFNAKFVNYTPSNDPSICIAPIALASSSSSDSGNLKSMFDGKSYTRWTAGGDSGGIGEFVDMRLNDAYPIKAFMIQSGNCYSDWLFNVSNRPVTFTLDFYDYNETEKTSTLVESITVHVDNTQSKQYIHFNKSVSSNYVRLTINEVVEGSIYKKACITEFSLYSENSDS
ncbi:MAG: discoidin domain-containing protein [Clostridia bacterium]|nr:discoidin domain-containing protein [Clostridia bacterium]